MSMFLFIVSADTLNGRYSVQEFLQQEYK